MNATRTCTGWLVGLLLSAIAMVGAAACATQDEPNTQSEESELGNCCSDGAFFCSTNLLLEYDYAPPGCGELLKPRAQSLCAARCGHACTDTGWMNSCP